jgi:hypothetical protein
MNLNDLTVEEITEFADSPAIFEKGQRCYHSGLVDQFFMSGKGIKAKVKENNDTYSLEIRTGGGKVTADCTCGYEGEVCEHIVAVLLYSMLGDPEDEGDDAEDEFMDNPHVIPLPVNALEQLLTGQLNFQDLLGLAAQLETELSHVKGGKSWPDNVIQFPRSRKMSVAELKDQVKEFFRQSPETAEDGEIGSFPVFPFYEPRHPRSLYPVFAQVDTLSLPEQIDVLWYIVTYGNLTFNKAGTLVGNDDIAEAVGLFAVTVNRLGVQMPEKEVYINNLVAAFDWPLFLNDYLNQALKDGLDTVCSTEEELRYAIASLEASGVDNKSMDWVIDAYHAVGDKEKFVQLFEKHLDTPGDYLSLANYYSEEEDIPKSIEVLERWIAECTPQKPDDVRAWEDLYREKNNDVLTLLEELLDYYSQEEDTPKVYQMMMLWLRIDGLSLFFYNDLKSVAQKLKCWEACQRQIQMFARDEGDILAEIYLNEKDWDRAIALMQTVELSRPLQLAIARGVREQRPQEAIGLYKKLVEFCIHKKTRTYYQNAAEYAQEIQEIYLEELDDPQGWEDYISSLRTKYLRYRALQEELDQLEDSY